MLTSEDLQAIVKVIHPLIKAEGDAIRKDMATKADIQAVKKYIDSKPELLPLSSK